MVVVTFRFSNPLISTLGVEALRVRLGVAETDATDATRATREAHREEANIVVVVVVVVVVNAVETLGQKGHGLSSLLVLPISQSSFTSRWLGQLGLTALPENNRYETEVGRHCKDTKGVSEG